MEKRPEIPGTAHACHVEFLFSRNKDHLVHLSHPPFPLAAQLLSGRWENYAQLCTPATRAILSASPHPASLRCLPWSDETATNCPGAKSCIADRPETHNPYLTLMMSPRSSWQFCSPDVWKRGVTCVASSAPSAREHARNTSTNPAKASCVWQLLTCQSIRQSVRLLNCCYMLMMVARQAGS